MAAWMDRRLLPVVLVVLAACNVGIGLNWVISPEADLSSASYVAAKHLAPMWAYGWAFIALTALAVTLVAVRGRGRLSGYAFGGLLGGMWALWTTVFTLAGFASTTASLAAAIYALSMLALHVVAGLALSHRSLAPLTRRA